jgi:uncharacterized protein (DUF433 family)
MPIYVCYRGDCSHLAFQEEGGKLIVAKDVMGQEWLCVESQWEEMPADSTQLTDLWAAQVRAHQQGFNIEGTQLMFLRCEDEVALRRKIILDTYPPAGESMAQVMHAGWLMSLQESCTGKPNRLVLVKDEEYIEVEGETREEAWYRAVQKVTAHRQAKEEACIMSALIDQTLPVPLRADAGGSIRVGKSRVSLDVVAREFDDGSTPEEIVQDYPTLALADVYAVVAFYLQHREAVEAYLKARRGEAERLRQEIEAKQPRREDLRAKLLARRAQREQAHASPGE